MRKNLLRLALPASALAVFCLAATASARQDETEHVSKTMKIGSGGTLVLKSFSGHVTITGADRSDVAIEATRHAPRERLNRVTLDIRTEGSDVVIEANKHDRSWDDHDNVVSTDFEIKVPRKTNLDVHVFSAGVEINGVEGSNKVHSFSSGLHLIDVIGPVTAQTFSGAVEIRAKAWQEHQTIEVKTFSGSIDLKVPDNARGSVNFDSFSGKLTSDVPLMLHSSSRKSLSATLGSGDGGDLRFKTFSGSVHIAKL
jgi:DUF4097 and DUF4098 domain-containing protein YvlB